MELPVSKDGTNLEKDMRAYCLMMMHVTMTILFGSFLIKYYYYSVARFLSDHLARQSFMHSILVSVTMTNL